MIQPDAIGSLRVIQSVKMLSRSARVPRSHPNSGYSHYCTWSAASKSIEARAGRRLRRAARSNPFEVRWRWTRNMRRHLRRDREFRCATSAFSNRGWYKPAGSCGQKGSACSSVARANSIARLAPLQIASLDAGELCRSIEQAPGNECDSAQTSRSKS